MDEQISAKAIEATLNGKDTFCKFLTANDSGETGGHQSGILISKSAKSIHCRGEKNKGHSLPEPWRSLRKYWFLTNLRIIWTLVINISFLNFFLILIKLFLPQSMT